ncbi:MAG: hypothetical protein N3D11_17850 [Candidatus Sumerlaeia bacterium]|nr:hypothetical protein [Candidatus Sumerlaeia bacterium]
MKRIKPIHDFGPAVGQYAPADRTDIRETWFRAIAADMQADLKRSQAVHKPECLFAGDVIRPDDIERQMCDCVL